MDKDFVKGLKQGLGFLTVILVFLGVVYAVGFHNANEIIGGVFQGNYTFEGSIDLVNTNNFNTPQENKSKIVFFQGNRTTTLGNVIDNKTKLLIHSNTTDGSQSFIDSSINSYTVGYAGDVHHETTNAKPGFGTTSIAFDGNTDYVNVVGNWALGAGEFTVDFWAYHNSGGVNHVLVGTGCFSGSAGRYGWQIGHDNNLGVLGFGYDYNSGWAIDTRTSYSTSATTWNHYAVTRDSSNNLRVFLNGNVVSTTSTSVNIIDPTDRALNIGLGGNDCSTYLNGYIDEVRIVIGEAKWAGTFTPDSVPYNNTIPGNVTQGLLRGVYIINESGNYTYLG